MTPTEQTGPQRPLAYLALLLLILPLLLSPEAAAAADPTREPSSTTADAGAALTTTTIEELEGGAEAVTQRLRPIMAAATRLPADLGLYVDRISDPAQGPVEPWAIRLAVSFLGGLAFAVALPRWLSDQRRRLPQPANTASRIVTAFLGDAAGLVALLVVSYSAQAAWFDDHSPRSELAVSLLGGLIQWRALMLPVDLLLRPREPEARAIEAPEHHAGSMRQLAAWLLGFVAFSHAGLRALHSAKIPIESVQLLALIFGIVNAAVALYFVNRLRLALAKPSPSEGVTVPIAPTQLRRLWYPLALAFIFAAAVAWLLGAVFEELSIYWSLIDTGGIFLGMLVLQAVAVAWLSRSAPTSADAAAEDRKTRRHRMIRRCLRAALWLAGTVLVIEIWMARLAHLLPAAQWHAWRGSVISAAVTLYIAYVLWQVVLFHTEHRVPVLPQPIGDTNGGPPPIATRLQTMMPVLRIFMLVTIVLVALLIALSNLGVNTTSLIAGASIFGLAISFGSQSLVHDIVSGIFFMADDAFRIGEYIDTGRAKGTVEGMSVRSLRMRHQNGQIHVIPFGQIQQVTNFSRDWTTMKFNLRLALDTDVELVRKTVKQIGLEMMKDPDLAAELYQPLKLQGVTEIDANGLAVRLKFTARPQQPTFVYREALKRIYKRFQEKGIEFANTSVMVQTRGEAQTPEEAAKLATMAAAAQAGALSKTERNPD
jgi:small-conductance mechanosensitive channel